MKEWFKEHEGIIKFSVGIFIGLLIGTWIKTFVFVQ